MDLGTGRSPAARRAVWPLPFVVVGLVVAGLVAVHVAHRATSPPGNSRTDHAAQILTTAISYPRHTSIEGYAQAAAATPGAQGGEVAVLKVSRTSTSEYADPFGELDFWIHFPGYQPNFGPRVKPITACYRASFALSGLASGPDRVDCPAGARPLVVPPAPPPVVVPGAADRALAVLLGEHGPLTPRHVRARMITAVAAHVDGTLPTVAVQVVGADVGVAVHGDTDCLLGRRTSGHEQVWRPAAIQVEPGELACDPATALDGPVPPPH